MKKLTYIFLLLVFLLKPIFPQPTLQWAKTYNGPGSSIDGALWITLDDTGNVYVTGGSDGGFGTHRDVATIKYSPSGQQLWVTRFNGIENADDIGRGIVLDNNGNIYVSGCYLLKYRNLTGDTLWVKRLINFGMCGDVLNIDSLNFLLTSGRSSTGYYTAKLDTSGNLVWLKNLISPTSNGGHFVNDQYVDRFGNVIVTGRLRNSLILVDYACGTVKYTPNGDTVWVRLYNGSDNSRPWDEGYACASDDSGNVYVAGLTRRGNGIPGDVLIIKYKPNGDTAWTKLYGNENDGESAFDMEMDKNGNIYIAGDRNGGNDIIAKFNNNGVFQWERSYPVYGFAVLPKLKLDTAGNVYITSQVVRGTVTDIGIYKFDSLGNQVWSVQYLGTGMESNAPYNITVDGMFNVYVVGVRSTNGGDYLTLKYSQTVGIEPISTEIPNKFSLSQNFPNPFNPVTKIRFNIPANVKHHSSNVKLIIYDLLGKEVATLVDEQLKPGSYEVSWDASNLPSGTYFYKLITEAFIESKKMILIK